MGLSNDTAEPPLLEDWAERTQGTLEEAMGYLWYRLRQGQFTSPAEMHALGAAHRHAEQAIEQLLKAAEAARAGQPPLAEPVPPQGEGKRNAAKERGHLHVWNERNDGSAVCTVPWCGLLAERGEARPKETP